MNQFTHMMGLGTPGDLRQGPDGRMYGWVEGLDAHGRRRGGWTPYSRLHRRVYRLCAYTFPRRFGKRPLMRPARPSTQIRPIYSRTVRPAASSVPRIMRPGVVSLRGLGAPAEVQGLLGVGYPGSVLQGPGGHLYGWISGYDGLGNPLGFWGRLKRLAQRGLKFIAKRVVPKLLPMATQLLPFIPGIGPAAATALKVARGAGLLGIAETGTPIYLGLDGYVYGVEGVGADMVHGLGADPIHGLEADYVHGMGADPFHGLGAEYVHGMGADPIHGLEADYVHGMGAEPFHGLGADYVHGMGADPIHGLGAEYVHGMGAEPIHGLGAEYVHGMGADPIHGMGAEYVHGMGADPIHGLGAEYVHGMGADPIHGLEADYVHGMGAEPFHGLEADYVHGMGADQMHGMGAEPIHGLEADYVHGMGADQFHGLEADYVHGMGAEPIHGLEADYVHGVGAEPLHGLDAGEIHVLHGNSMQGMDGYMVNPAGMMGYEPTRPPSTPMYRPPASTPDIWKPHW